MSWPKLHGTSGVIPQEYAAQYSAELQGIQFRAARTLALASFMIFPLFGFTGIDYLFAPNHYRLFLAMRTALATVYLLFFFLLRRERYQKRGELVSFLILVSAGLSIDVMIRVLGYDSPYYAGLNIIYVAIVLIPTTAWKTLLGCGCVYAGYVIPIVLFDSDRLDLKAFVGNNQFQLCTIIVAAIANHIKFNIIRDQILNRLTISKQKQQLEVLDKFKREFIANVTHELKTPLAIVMANADLLLEDTEDEEKRAAIELIGKAANQLGNHVDRIIAVSNVDDPDSKPELGRYDYTGVVRNVFELYEGRAREENITYALNAAPGPLVVNVDVVRIEEVLNNLIQNAFKFTPGQGIITVTVGTDGEDVYTEVSDSGVGIPEDKIDRVFDRMYQADGVLSKRHAGIGLGLYICKKNVETHGGTITVSSKQGQGTSFKFSLPLHVDQTVPVQNLPYKGEDRRSRPRRSGQDRRSKPDRRAAERRRRYEYQQSLGLDDLARMTYAEDIRNYEDRSPAKPTILLVEDNAGMMKVIVEALREDYNLLLAFDAFEALRRLEDRYESVSLILSDIMMPGMSGFDFGEKVAEREEWRHIPLIFITALMSQHDQLRGYEVGATDYIVKPYNIKILKEKVAHWISRRRYEVLLRDASASLEERVEQLSRIRDIILHEIRNPLQMIVGAGYFVDRLKQKSLDRASQEERRLWENVIMLEQGTEALRSVLDATRAIDVSAASSRRPEPLVNVVDEAIELTRHLMGGVRVEAELEAMEGLTINCNRHLLVQVLVNLLRNAAEAIEERQPREGGWIRITHEEPGNGRTTLKISDNGIGMAPEVAENLFKFKYTTKKDGTGIGLHFSKMIVKLHEGTIVAESTVGKGTTFRVELPLLGASHPVLAS